MSVETHPSDVSPARVWGAGVGAQAALIATADPEAARVWSVALQQDGFVTAVAFTEAQFLDLLTKAPEAALVILDHRDFEIDLAAMLQATRNRPALVISEGVEHDGLGGAGEFYVLSREAARHDLSAAVGRLLRGHK